MAALLLGVRKELWNARHEEGVGASKHKNQGAAMVVRVLGATIIIGTGLMAAAAQTTVQPVPAPAPPIAPPVISDATHCRDANGMVRLKVGATGAPSTTGTA